MNVSGKTLGSILLLLVLTTNFWVFSQQNNSPLTTHIFQSMSQLSALLGTLLLSLTLIMSSRVRIIEKVFGGIDRMFTVHHLAGAIGFVLLLSHPILLILQSFPQINMAALYLLPGSNFAYTLGIVSIYLMFASFICMMFMRLPYHIWLKTHQLLGIAFLLGTTHALLIDSDISRNILLRSWMIIWLAAGTISVIYTLIFQRRFGPRYLYVVDETRSSGDVITLSFLPLHQRSMEYYAGQFVYLETLHPIIGRELHPFSLASSPLDGKITLSLKVVGDYTAKLFLLKKGDRVIFHGPYGMFGQHEKSENEQSLWVAGGIGVTPFLGLLRNELQKKSYKEIWMVFLYHSLHDNVFVEELRMIAQRLPHLHLLCWQTARQGRLRVNAMFEHFSMPCPDSVLVCGPPPLRQAIIRQCHSLGISERCIRYEDFQLL